MQEQTAFHSNILDNMVDGVMALDQAGTVIMFNPAAGKILGLDPEDVLGNAFGAVFLMLSEANDAFNQAILDAVYEKRVGQHEMVDFERPDETLVHLSVTSSYLAAEEGDEAQGVIVVFNDITAIKTLQEEDKRLRSEIEEAYVSLEETNESLRSAMHRFKVVRLAVAGLLTLVILGAGVYTWTLGGSEMVTDVERDIGFDQGNVTQDESGLSFMTVSPQDATSDISLSGKLEPIETVNVVAPFSGRIVDRHFSFGQRVEKGAKLFTLDTTELMVKLREARSAYIKARQHFHELKNWNISNDVSRARRSYMRSKSALDSAKRKLDETKLLFEKGIVPRNEHESAQQQYENQQLDMKNAEEELASTMGKGDKENVEIARMELDNAKSKLDEMQSQVKQAVVVAPVEGVVIQAVEQNKEKSNSVEPGVTANQGQVLIAVANLEGLSVRTEVDEVDIGKLELDQKVRVTGDAFPGLTLKGEIEEISSQAKEGQSIPKFDVRVAIDDVTPEQKRVVRLGMSAILEVLVYDNPDALLVPLSAVSSKSGKHYVGVRNPDGTVRQVEVVPGMTTMTSVEILKGIKKGDQIALPKGSPDVDFGGGHEDVPSAPRFQGEG